MNRERKRIGCLVVVSFLTGLLLTSCIDDRSELIVKDYDLTWKNIQRSRALYKKDRIVPPYIFAAGITGNYIVLKQHPLRKDNSLERDSTYFYVVEITDNTVQDKPIYGPLAQPAFDSISAALHLQDVSFEYQYPIGRHWKMR